MSRAKILLFVLYAAVMYWAAFQLILWGLRTLNELT